MRLIQYEKEGNLTTVESKKWLNYPFIVGALGSVTKAGWFVKIPLLSWKVFAKLLQKN